MKVNASVCILHLLTLNWIMCIEVFASIKTPIFSPSMPERCPSPPIGRCECSADDLNRKKVTCSDGGLLGIPVDKMDRGIQVLNITAPMSNRNRIILGRIFMELHQLEEVHITYSNLPAIGDSSFWPGAKLRVLNLSHNNITIIRERDFNGLTNLTILNLSDNHLSRAPSASFRLLTNLTELSLARNKFTKLVPRMLYKLDKLSLLDLSDNLLQEIHPDDFKDAKSLKHLLLSGCRLQKLHSLIYHSLPNLIELDLCNNLFSYISPREFIPLSKLKILRLNGNRISVIVDHTFSGLHTLDFLSLSRNSITTLSSCTFCNSSIKSVDISYNKFTSFQYKVLEPLNDVLISLNVDANRNLIDPSSSIMYLLRPLKRLKHLSAAILSLDDTILDSTFTNLQSLISLNISRNKFTNISTKLLEPLINLRVLDLSHNEMFGVSDDLLAQINSVSNLKSIFWNDNPWSCFRCHTLPLFEWINTKPDSYFNVCNSKEEESSSISMQYCVKCVTPSELSGKYLHLITEYDLEWCADPRVQFRLRASEPKVGLFLAFLIIFALIIVIISVIVLYKKQGAVYYTHEDDKIEDKSRVFSVTEATAIKQVNALSHHSSPTITASSHSKPESPSAGPSTFAGPSTIRIIRPKVMIYI